MDQEQLQSTHQGLLMLLYEELQAAPSNATTSTIWDAWGATVLTLAIKYVTARIQRVPFTRS